MDSSPLDEKAIAALPKARSALVLEHPFFGSIALKLHLRTDDACRDLWCDGKDLAANPAYASSLPEIVLVGAVAHEVLHIAFSHHVRRGDRSPGIWNKACDYAINSILAESGFTLPEGSPCRREYSGKSAEDIYRFLAALQDDESHGASVESRQGEESTQVDGGGSASLGGEQRSASAQDARSSGRKAEGEDGEQQKGSEKASQEARGKEQPASHPFMGEVRDHPVLRGNSSDAAQKAVREADMTLMAAAREALRMGDMPAGLMRLIKRRLTPCLGWRELLARFMEQVCDSDYSWTVPNRRYLHQDLYLPSRREARLPSVALAVDCSGSVDERLLARFAAELSVIIADHDAELAVFYHDIEVTGIEYFSRADLPLQLSPAGGGGTDFRPVPGTVESAGISPSCLIWFTDMECDRFPEEPSYPVLWVVPEGTDGKPPFGEVISMPAGPA